MRVDLIEVNQAYNEAHATIDKFVSESVKINRDFIKSVIKNLNETPNRIIEIFSDQILSGYLAQFEQQKVISLISSGALFSMRNELISRFKEDAAIVASIRERYSKNEELFIY